MKSSKFPYLNDYDPRHFEVPRRANPPWHEDPGIDWDTVVVGAVMTLAATVLLFLSIKEGML